MGMMIKNKKLTSDDILFYLILIDSLFFPYIRQLHCSISMILLVVWVIKNTGKVFNKKIFVALAVFVTFGCLSIIWLSIHFPQYAKSALVPVLTTALAVLYYMFYCEGFKKKNYKIENIFFILMIFSMCFALVYLKSPQLYFNLRSHWSLNGEVIQYVSAYYNRYTFIQSDPNSNPCIMTAMMLYILIYAKNMEKWKRVLTVLMTGGLVAISISATGIVVYCLSLFIYFITRRNYSFQSKVDIKSLLIILCIFVAGVAVLISLFSGRANLAFNFIDNLVARVGSNVSGGTMSGRSVIWKNILSSFDWWQHIIIGRGTPVTDAAEVLKPHNGHFYVILSYGVTSWLAFLYIFFRKPKYIKFKNWLPLFPIFILFTMNTLLSDYRAILGLAIVAAACHSKKVTCEKMSFDTNIDSRVDSRYRVQNG